MDDETGTCRCSTNSLASTRESRVSQNTWVPVSVVGAVLLVLGAAVLYIHNWVVTDALWKQRVDTKLQVLETSLIGKEPDNWGRADMELWTNDLRYANPNLSVPKLPEYKP